MNRKESGKMADKEKKQMTSKSRKKKNKKSGGFRYSYCMYNSCCGF